MSSTSKKSSSTVVIVGGSGGLAEQYRGVVEGQGMSLRHYERRFPSGSARSNIALVIVMVGMVSHPLREQAQRLAHRDQAPIVYLRTPSVSALRQAVASLGLTTPLRPAAARV